MAAAAEELAPVVRTARACQVPGVSRASVYRGRQPKQVSRRRVMSLNGAPAGIDAEFAWIVAGSEGAGQRVVAGGASGRSREAGRSGDEGFAAS